MTRTVFTRDKTHMKQGIHGRSVSLLELDLGTTESWQMLEYAGAMVRLFFSTNKRRKRRTEHDRLQIVWPTSCVLESYCDDDRENRNKPNKTFSEKSQFVFLFGESSHFWGTFACMISKSEPQLEKVVRCGDGANPRSKHHKQMQI